MGLILDDYPGAYCAFSSRLLRSAYSGDLATILETGGGTTQAFGPKGPRLEISAADVASFCGANTGLTKVFNDQAGYAGGPFDVTHGTQSWLPQIYDGANVGAFAGLSEIPVQDFTIGNTMGLWNNGGLAAVAISSWTAYVSLNYVLNTAQEVFKYVLDIGTTRLVFFAKGVNEDNLSIWQGGSDKIAHVQASGGEMVIAYRVDGANSAIFVNGVEVATGTVNQSAISAGSNLGIGGPNGGASVNNSLEMKMGEVILYPAAHDDATIGEITDAMSAVTVATVSSSSSSASSSSSESSLSSGSSASSEEAAGDASRIRKRTRRRGDLNVAQIWNFLRRH